MTHSSAQGVPVRRNATLFVVISLVSGFGSTALSLTAGLWLLDLTGSASLAGLAGLCVYAPTLAAPWLGGLADRWPRRPLLITVDVLLAVALLPLLTVHTAAGAGIVFAVLVAYGMSFVLLDAGESALLPAALPAGDLGRVNGWRSSAQEGMKLLAPPAGAALYAGSGAAAVTVVVAAMPLIAATCYALLTLPPHTGIRPRPASPTVPSRAAGGVRAAWTVLVGRPDVRVPVLTASVAIGASGLTTAAIFAHVVEGIGLPSTFLGWMGCAQGAGSLVAGLLAGPVIARAGTRRTGAAGAVLFGAACLAWCLPGPATMIAGSLLAGAGLPWTLVAAVTAVQSGVPDRLLGRASAISGTLMFGPIALTNPAGAAVVHLGAGAPVDLVPLLVAAGATLTAGAAAGLRSRASGGTRPLRTGRRGW